MLHYVIIPHNNILILTFKIFIYIHILHRNEMLSEGSHKQVSKIFIFFSSFSNHQENLEKNA